MCNNPCPSLINSSMLEDGIFNSGFQLFYRMDNIFPFEFNKYLYPLVLRYIRLNQNQFVAFITFCYDVAINCINCTWLDFDKFHSVCLPFFRS